MTMKRGLLLLLAGVLSIGCLNLAIADPSNENQSNKANCGFQKQDQKDKTSKQSQDPNQPMPESFFGRFGN